MIKLFRNIRQNLLNEGKTTKYFKYAIGEIILVVIGILIALQINTWNEDRKAKVLERKMLTELVKSLEGNCNMMIQDSVRRVKWNHSSNIIILAIQNDLEYSDSLNVHFQNARIPGTNLALSTAGYEGLKNIGFNIITSDKIRNSIIELFEIHQKNLKEEMEYFESFQPDRQKQVDKLFSYDDTLFDPANPFEVPIIPHDYTALQDDTYYLSMIKSVKIQRSIIGVHLARNLKESQSVLQLIKNELKEQFDD